MHCQSVRRYQHDDDRRRCVAQRIDQALTLLVYATMHAPESRMDKAQQKLQIQKLLGRCQPAFTLDAGEVVGVNAEELAERVRLLKAPLEGEATPNDPQVKAARDAYYTVMLSMSIRRYEVLATQAIDADPDMRSQPYEERERRRVAALTEYMHLAGEVMNARLQQLMSASK